MINPSSSSEGIALVALAGRFPGADSVEAFWDKLCAGAECIRRFTPEELAASGAAIVSDPNHVPARGVVEKADHFDAAFFGYTPREAELIDPQHRVFLECAAEALERAGCDPRRYEGLIGVFGGASLNTYAVNHLYSYPKYRAAAGSHQLGLANEKDYLTARVSYKLNLRGPSVNVQTACATSLTAVCIACQSLLSHQCDLALAGGASLLFPQAQGYVHQPGGIFSPDGHCRTFDAEARGTVPGDGVAVVALKRLADAQADGDRIYAVIKGFAFGNDGALKVGFAAPSADGQMETVMLAQAMAGVDPATIGYVEAHGTATVLGDPIELESLAQAFRAGTDRKNFCAIGSVKSNIGHLDAAAGAAGLIKAALALHHRRIPPSLHFKAPNPQIDFANSAFRVADRLADWPAPVGAPRRAGVNSMGMGGTNVHVVLEEAPSEPATAAARSAQVLVLSAKTPSALDRATENLAAHLRENPGLALADIAWTLQTGRREFAHRRAVVARTPDEAVAALQSPAPAGDPVAHDDGKVAFLFTGQGAQKVNMGRGLYEQEPLFRTEVDRCARLLQPRLGLDLRAILYPPAGSEEAAQAQLDQTRLTQPALFVFEYALARLWMSWGVTPAALLGHSLGEYVAACLAGVFSLEDALGLVATRARLMQEQPAGAMLAVRLPEAELRPLLPAGLSIATLNSVAACVVSGPTEAVTAFERVLGERGAGCKRLRTSHAFHSAMMEPALAPFAAAVAKVRRAAPAIPMLSNVTGTWLTAEQAMSPDYWASHIRQAVRFADGVGVLCAESGRVFLEVGPGATLAGLARQHPAAAAAGVVASLPAPGQGDDLLSASRALGELWQAGVRVDWTRLHAGERRRRVLLPTYPFERQRHCIEPAPTVEHPTAAAAPAPSAAATECIVAVQVTTTPRDDSLLGRLTALFSEVSGIDLARQPEASFASLGFDSLLLAQATAAIKRQFGVTVLFGDLLGKLGTVRAVADFVAENSAALPPTPAETPAEKAVAPAPPTDAQREIWLASQVSEAASCAYNETRRLRFRGPLRRAALHAALQSLVDRHDALRTTFSPDGGEQRTAPHLTLAMPVETTGTADEAARTEAETPFDLENGPLIRTRLLHVDEDDHILFITIHHLVCDGQAWGLLLQELAEHYRGGASLPPPPLQIGDYARTLATRAAGEEGETAQAYWCRRFADGVPAFELPADHPRPAKRNFEGGREDRLLPPGLRDRLRALGARRSCTFFNTLLAAFYVWLRRLSGEADIVIGVPVAERSPEGADRLVAHCIDFMPVRLSTEGSCAFEELLTQTKEVFMEALEHRQCSFGRIVRALDLRYDAGRHPLAVVTFNVSRMREGLDFGDVAVEAMASKVSSLAFDLSFNVVETGDELRLDCRYSRALFEATTIRRWLGHFETLLAALAADPSCAVDRLPLLGDAERRQILEDWNATATDYPRDRTVHALFAEQAALTPDAVAVVQGGRTFSYGELDRQANQLAHRLRGLGARPGSLVGFCLERSPELLVALLAILKAGGAYVSFDPAYPPARLAAMIEDARPVVMLTTTALKNRLPDAAVPQLCFDEPEFASVAAEDDSRAPDVETGPESLAYVCFTSGSTGRPKGVCVPHRGVVRLVRGTDYARFAPDEVFLQLAPVAFDASTFEIWGALLNGARLVLFPAHAPTLAELGETIRRHGVTTLWLSAGLFQQVVEERCDCLQGVRQLLAGGDVLSPPHVRRVLEQFPGCRLINGYGPTENTTFTCCHPVTEKAAGRRAIPIGRPIANTRVYVLDERMQPAPIGVPGELYTGGDGLALGYLGRPELTAEKFVPDPFGGGPAGRLYKTGDRVRWLADGAIDFIGRIDSQVKIRGFRVELDEIEHALGRHPGLRTCAVVAQPGENGDKRLAACLVAASSPSPAPAELRRFLSGSLPDYMVPAEADFVFLDALPLDPNGKVDRRALAGLRAARPAPGNGRALPRDAVERQLAELWEEILGVSHVGLNDRFFELGGHSLLAMRLLARIEDRFGRKLPLAAVFEAPSVAELATLIRGHDFSARSSLVEIKGEGTRPPLFLVHGVGGGMFWGYANLARHLGPDQPLYAFKSRGLDGGEEFGTIEEMAAAYVADLRAFQPQGPYLLGGYCFGGNVACEMARQLRAAGEEIGLLVLMNCVPHGGSYSRGRATPAWLGRYLLNLGGLLAQLHASGPEAKLAYLHWKAGAVRQKVRRWLGRTDERAPEFEVGETVDLAGYSVEQRRLWAAHVRALCRYRIQPFDAQVVLLRSRLHQRYCSFAHDCGWGEFARGGVSVGIVPGSHESILEEPHVAALAKQLRDCLERRSEEEPGEAEGFRAELAEARA